MPILVHFKAKITITLTFIKTLGYRFHVSRTMLIESFSVTVNAATLIIISERSSISSAQGGKSGSIYLVKS